MKEKIKDLFHWYGTTASFMTHKKMGLIPCDSIAFLGQTGQIYTQGEILGVSTEEFKVFKDIVTNIEKLFTEGAEDTIDNIYDMLHFLQGYTGDDRLKIIIDKITDALNSHISDNQNPHNVTKEQVGLGNVDNTSDADKPVSNAVLETLNDYVKFDDTVTAEKAGVMTPEDYERLNNMEDGATHDTAITIEELNEILI